MRKISYKVIISSALIFSLPVLASNFTFKGLGFRAPQVTDAETDVVDPEKGEIVYDSSDTSFKGYNGTSWMSLSNASTVVSPVSGGVKLLSAYITFPLGTPTVDREDGNWIDTLTDNGDGDVSINLVSGTFSSTPNCSCTSGSGNFIHCNLQMISNAQLRLRTYADTTAQDGSSSIICIGQP